MKKWTAVLAAAACMLSLAACGNKDVDDVNSFGTANNGIYLNADLSVTDCIVEDFAEDKYDLEEFRGYLDDDIAAYNEEHVYTSGTAAEGEEAGEDENVITASITVKTCEVKNDRITLELLYATAEDYVSYNAETIGERGGSVLETGTLDQAGEEVLSASYVDKDGAVVDVKSLVDKGKGAEYRYMICDFDAYIYGEGKIYAFTAAGEYTQAYGSVTVPAGQQVIVIFK